MNWLGWTCWVLLNIYGVFKFMRWIKTRRHPQPISRGDLSAHVLIVALLGAGMFVGWWVT